MGMRLRIGEQEEALGYKGDFCFKATAEALDIPGTDTGFFAPLTVEGTLENTGGSFRVTGEVRAERSFVCDRCLAKASAVETYPFMETFRRGDESEDTDGFGDDGIDLVPLVRDTVLAALPIRNLCRPDCKGLCPKCGADLNQGECGCDREVVDARLEVLKQWMENHSDRV